MRKVKTISIRGNQYATVAARLAAFREDHPDWSVITEIQYRDPEEVVFVCRIQNEGVTLATGHAHEVRTSTGVNQSSYVENCETSSVGRALAILGYGIDGEIASLDEMDNKGKLAPPQYDEPDRIAAGTNYNQGDINRKLDQHI